MACAEKIHFRSHLFPTEHTQQLHFCTKASEDEKKEGEVELENRVGKKGSSSHSYLEVVKRVAKFG